MKLKTFQGRTMAETLNKVKRQFGRDAVILNTRTLTKGGVLGFGGKSYVEITAARRMSDLPASLRRGPLKRRDRGSGSAEGAALAVPTHSATTDPPRTDALLLEVSELKSLVGDVLRETRRSRVAKVPKQLYDTYLSLVENKVGDKIAEQLVAGVQQNLTEEQLHDRDAVRQQLAGALATMLPTAGPIHVAPRGQPTIIALVGPTGVGKTTTVAKLAANFSLRERRRVGLITIDTYRIAAVEQLKTYAQIIGVPLQVVASPQELKDAVARMAECDVILVDTAGRSQRDPAKIRELKAFFSAVPPHEVHLVLSTTGGEAVLTETIERFGAVGIDRVIFTKLDEAIGFGVILTCLQQADAKLSYVTTGQDVPDDIEIGEGPLLASLILGDREPGPLDGVEGTHARSKRTIG